MQFTVTILSGLLVAHTHWYPHMHHNMCKMTTPLLCTFISHIVFENQSVDLCSEKYSMCLLTSMGQRLVWWSLWCEGGTCSSSCWPLTLLSSPTPPHHHCDYLHVYMPYMYTCMYVHTCTYSVGVPVFQVRNVHNYMCIHIYHNSPGCEEPSGIDANQSPNTCACVHLWACS
jgi:hypothetical protein